MSLSSDNMMKLMAYADGELDGAALEEAQKLLATDPDSVRFVEQIAGLGEIVTLGYDAGAGKTTAKFDVADAVMSRVAPVMNGTPEKQTAKKDSNVSSLAAARAKRGSSMKVGAGIAVVLALAASVFLFAQHRSDEAPMASAVAPVSVAPANGVVATNGGTGVSVSTVNSPGEAVSVFYLPTANELSTSVVVWVDETGEK
jgi:anti-sigma factor RsiW